MFLRFAVTQIDEDSHKPQGVLTAAYSLLDSGDLTAHESSAIPDLLYWFEKNLASPPESFDASRAIFWFRSDSQENIRRIWELVHLLRTHGYHVDVFKSRRLANIAWHDKSQVAAYPSAKDAKVTVQ
jgi:hypothetical protein